MTLYCGSKTHRTPHFLKEVWKGVDKYESSAHNRACHCCVALVGFLQCAVDVTSFGDESRGSEGGGSAGMFLDGKYIFSGKTTAMTTDGPHPVSPVVAAQRLKYDPGTPLPDLGVGAKYAEAQTNAGVCLCQARSMQPCSLAPGDFTQVSVIGTHQAYFAAQVCTVDIPTTLKT